MKTYFFTVLGRIQAYAFTGLCFLAILMPFKSHALIDVVVAVIGVSFLVSVNGIAFTNGYVVLDDDGIKYFDQVVWRRGVPQGASWNEIIRVEGTYLLPWLPVFVLYVSVDGGKERAWYVPITFFPSDLVNDIMSRLSENVEVKLASDFSKNYNLD